MYQSLIKPLAQDIKTFVLDTLFPVSCLGCGKEGNFLCDYCKTKLTKLEHQHCIVCQKPSVAGLTHPGCQSPQAADALISFFDYHDKVVKDLIIKGKYYFLSEIFEIFADLIAKRIVTDFNYILADDIILTPVPLNKWRKKWRGFNQTEILCKNLGEHLKLRTINVLMRSKYTKTQKDLKKEQRIKNVSNAFALSTESLNFKSLPAGQAGLILNKNVILMDDVVTTGSTLLEAAKVLKRNGAAKVICLTIARD